MNVVTGTGPEAGAPLLRHPDVDTISFTGSTRVGRTVLEAASSTAKRIHLELGGKAPFVVFDDADLEAAIDAMTPMSPSAQKRGPLPSRTAARQVSSPAMRATASSSASTSANSRALASAGRLRTQADPTPVA